MGQIRVMTAALANQIAAGEVVERPASCVKELVENSLDAGAKSIYVAIEEGGIASITVQDDGVGMDEQDARLAFSRHATSKLMHAHDLFRVQTLGFRGEALASIAAVSRVEMLTRMKTTEYGVRVQGEGSELVSVAEPVGLPVGTRFQVKDLFFNTPARLKYLRSIATEQARCVEVVQRAALSRPDVAFRMDVGTHCVFQTNGAGRTLDVLATLYGVGEARQFIEFKGENTDYQLVGYMGRPTQGKSSRNYAHFFINGRPVRNLSIHQAVIAGYGARLMVNRHPMYALYVNMDPTLVDVNIHPHKAEVRFSEERDIAKLVQGTVAEALDRAFLVPTVDLGRTRDLPTEPHKPQPKTISDSQSGEQTRFSFQRVSASETGPSQSVRPSTSYSLHRINTSATDSRALINSALGPSRRESVQPDAGETAEEMALYGQERVTELSAEMERATDETTAAVHGKNEIPVRERLQALRVIGQALGVYILADDGESLYIIDQHAAHERVLYERFSARMNEQEIHRISLLAGISIPLSPQERVLFDSVREELEQTGLEFEDFGGNDMILRTIPDIWEGLDASLLVEELIHGLGQSTRQALDVRSQLREVVVLRACKAAIKANHRLTMMEMEALCQALPSLQDPFHCPHGRPIFIRMTNRDLEKEFRRIV